jgi:acid phosphatase
MQTKIVATALAAIALGCGLCAADTKTKGERKSSLHEFGHIVVIYQENHSFDNLYGLWGDVNGEPVNGLRQADPAHTIQLRSDGSTPYKCLLQNDVNLTSPTPLPTKCVDDTGKRFESAFANAPFKIDDYIASADTTCPEPGVFAPFGVLKGRGLAGGCTRDMVHRFYNETFQINDGKQNRYVTGSNGAGLAMGYYDTTKLPIYNYLHKPKAPNYVIADNFFQAAFGGSFLNHNWLIAANTPIFAAARNDGSENDFHSVVDANGMPANTPLYASPLGTAAKDSTLTASCSPPSGRPATPTNIVCGDFVINKVQPYFWPYAPGASDAKRLPPLTNPTIGDRLTDAKIDWAWYSGGWSNANGDVGAPGWTNGAGPNCNDPNADASAKYPHCPDKLFQYHHHPFNYYQNYAPGTAARADHLRDEAEFIQAAKSGRLKQVSFVKPLGEESEHPGYAGEAEGGEHLVDLINAILAGPNGRDTLIIVTYDEFGGSWDHVPPPPHNYDSLAPYDAWGPGTRVPALLVSEKFERSGVDHAAHDTTSILKLIEERFHLAPLGSRDAAARSLNTALQAAER